MRGTRDNKLLGYMFVVLGLAALIFHVLSGLRLLYQPLSNATNPMAASGDAQAEGVVSTAASVEWWGRDSARLQSHSSICS